jgi:nucleoid DNA-binding protein
MKISEYIAEALLHESPVNVPGFGWFEKKYTSATIHPVEHSFKPPSAELRFVPDATVVSDLLTKKIADSESISINDAHDRILDFVADCSLRLRDGNRVHIPPLGTLKLDLGGTLILEQNPDLNLNPDSFGLPGFISPAIQRRDTSPVITPLTPKKKIKPSVWIAAASFLILAAIAFATYQFDFLHLRAKKQNLQLATQAELIPEPVINPVEKDTEAIDTTQTLLPSSEPVVSSAPEPEKGGWFILAACFGSQHNAEKYLNNLKEQGFPASIEGQTRSGLYRVCYRSFASEEAAKAELVEIHTQNPNAYIIKLF